MGGREKRRERWKKGRNKARGKKRLRTERKQQREEKAKDDTLKATPGPSSGLGLQFMVYGLWSGVTFHGLWSMVWGDGS